MGWKRDKSGPRMGQEADCSQLIIHFQHILPYSCKDEGAPPSPDWTVFLCVASLVSSRGEKEIALRIIVMVISIHDCGQSPAYSAPQ